MSNSDEHPEELLISEALAEYMTRCDSGKLPDRNSFLEQHPEQREQLEELLNAADWIEQLAGPTLADLAKQPDQDSRPRPGELDNLRRAVEADIDETLPQFGSSSSRANEQTLPSQKVQGDSELVSGEHLPGTPQPDEEPRSGSEFSQPALPCEFGDYVLERVLGRGGMGVVYQGHQKQLDRPVAVKMIRSGALASEEEIHRFYAEARSAAKLDHPNIVTVYQCGEHEGHRYFSMDFVDGKDLSRLIADGPLDPRLAARYVRDAARAIQYAHDQGILHRDLKPANVLVDAEDDVHITDFGLAKSIGTETGLTATGAALGTPSYMSPEQAAGRTEDQHHATDVYSLGAILFTCITGRPPFKAPTVVQTIMHVIHRPAPKASSVVPNVESDLETILDVCLQKAPDRRYDSAGALADDLDRYLSGAPIQARPVSTVRRAWYWLLGVPIFGAVLDHRVVEPTDAHRWVQRGLISVALLFATAWAVLLASSAITKIRMPGTVRLAAGIQGGAYDQLGQIICKTLSETAKCEAIPVATAGSSENIERLENGEVDLALIQADALGSPAVAVVAPLYYEAVHIFVKKGSEIKSLAELKERSVLIGPDKAGSQSVAELLLGSAGLAIADIKANKSDWHELQEEPTADAAIVVSKLGSQDVTDLLCEGQYTLLALPNAWQFALDQPSFHPLLVSTDHYPQCELPATGIATVATTAFLAATPDTPPVLVRTVLHQLFSPEMVAAAGIVSAERAAHWQGIAWHPTAREFFQPYRVSKP